MKQLLLRLFVKDYKNTNKPSVRTAIGSLASLVGIIANFFLVVGKVTVGFLSGSVSIIADGLNNLLDAGGSIIALIGFKAASKKADKEHPFGHGRYEYIAGLAVAVLVLVVGIELGRSSIDKIINPTSVDIGIITFIVLGAAILLKIWLSRFNSSLGKDINSTTLKANGIDSRNDVIATTVVLISVLLSKFMGINLDGWAGLGVALFIIYNGIMLVKEALNPIIGEAPVPEIIDLISSKILEHECVSGVHDIIVHDYGPSRKYASAHVEIDEEIDSKTAHDVIDKIEKYFLEKYSISLIMHHDPIPVKEDLKNIME